jgi:hypothetical protein
MVAVYFVGVWDGLVSFAAAYIRWWWSRGVQLGAWRLESMLAL